MLNPTFLQLSPVPEIVEEVAARGKLHHNVQHTRLTTVECFRAFYDVGMTAPHHHHSLSFGSLPAMQQQSSLYAGNHLAKVSSCMRNSAAQLHRNARRTHPKAASHYPGLMHTGRHLACTRLHGQKDQETMPTYLLLW
jgi:hypothetical protein